MKIHELKTWTEPFAALASGEKRFEIRKNDRDFDLGDALHLREWMPEIDAYTGRELLAEVTYLVRGPSWGIPDGLCVMSIEVRGAS